ncbi:diacylglycerol/lipid kinase family protein [Agromyces mariniharenae]|uniref:Diacylglycerol kinase n=1 Tax=Agromyces mariniharenae TaxID=2604423 RepID=A0A5S4V2C6_9MICO|nr:diacylglycerol kinase family protein [Agromyces mariniharenae]TYL53132.1 diacylglycerol kinase [Agromyces mariniharenae]
MPSRSRAAVVYNPVKIDGDELRRAIAAEPAAADWGDTLWYETSVEDPGGGQAKAALEAGADMVIAAGGDGTIRAVAEVLGGTSTALALLPSGTGNLLARNLDLTLDDLGNSIHVAFSGADRRIDLAWAELRREDGSTDRAAYLVMAGFGLDAKMLSNTDEELKAKMGWLAYVAAIRTALRDENRMRMRYRLDRHRIRAVSAHTLIIGNCGSLPANILLLPSAAIDDGRFEAVFLRPESAWGWLQIMGKVIWENGVLRRTRWGRKLVGRDVDALRYVKGRRLEVVLSRPEEIELDGDGFGRARALRTWVDAGGLTVRVPPGERQPSEEQAEPTERRATQPDQPPPVEALPGEADDQSLPGDVTADESLPDEVTADVSGNST